MSTPIGGCGPLIELCSRLVVVARRIRLDEAAQAGERKGRATATP